MINDTDVAFLSQFLHLSRNQVIKGCHFTDYGHM